MGFFSTSNQTSINESGISSQYKPGLSAFALPQIDEAMQLAQQRARQPFNLQVGQVAFPTLSERGLFQPQERAFNDQLSALQQPFQQAVTQALGQISSNYANRGFVNPESVSAIAGSAAQNVAPQFAGLLSNIYGGVMNTAGQNVGSQLAFDQYQRQQLPFQIQSAEEQIRQQRMNAWRDQLALIPGFLGSSGSGSSSGPGLGYGMTTALFGGIGAGLGKAAGGGGGSDK